MCRLVVFIDRHYNNRVYLKKIMAEIESRGAINSEWAKKKVARPSQFGVAKIGVSRYGIGVAYAAYAPIGVLRIGFDEFGDMSEFSGIYQRRMLLVGPQKTDGPRTYQKRTIRMNFYEPWNDPSAGQITQREKMATAVAVWQGLTAEQKAVYSKNAIGKKLSGYNLCLRESMLS